MNYSSQGGIEIGEEGVREISNTEIECRAREIARIRNGSFFMSMMTRSENSCDADHERVSVDAEEALRVAGWIKEGKMGDYGDTDSVRFRRESGILVITFVPEKAGRKELRLEDAEALQLAAALASVRQNVSEVGQ